MSCFVDGLEKKNKTTLMKEYIEVRVKKIMHMHIY